MPKFLDFDISISIEGRRLPEYDVEVESDSASGEATVITCWIPSEVDKRFQIDIIPPPPPLSHHWNTVASFDGVESSGTSNIIFKDGKVTASSIEYEAVDQIDSKACERHFKFVPLEVTNDETASVGTYKIGEIGIKLVRAETYTPLNNSLEEQLSKEEYPDGIYLPGRVYYKSEQAKLAHCIQLGEKRESVAGGTAWWMGDGTKHMATFIFKYRDIDTLVAQGIAPKEVAASRMVPNPRKRRHTDDIVETGRDSKEGGAPLSDPSDIAKCDAVHSSPKKIRYSGEAERESNEEVTRVISLSSVGEHNLKSGTLNPKKRTYNEAIIEVEMDTDGERNLNLKKTHKRVKTEAIDDMDID
ncbi:hypothetical protein CC2G_007753 [Coprinopsis cinerea AmutBmut pab1-1]|nr:hypothetical protein CC2G_007753 [Coprinopsis cinerea AmutBmut pab1-1]